MNCMMLWCGGIVKSGIYPARCFPDPDHHPYGRADRSAAEGEHRKSGSPSCFHGDLFKHGNAAGTEPQTDFRRLCEGHPRSPCLQGNLAGGRGLYLYGGDTGTGSGRTWHQKDSTGTGGGCYHPWKLSEVEAVCGGFYHRIPSGKMLCHTGRGNAGGAA